MASSISASGTPSIALLTRQDSNGAFGLWSVGGDDLWLDAYVTDFLTRARERGFAVPQTASTLALDRLRNYVAARPTIQNGGRELAYALYVLARNGAAPIGDLRYLADAKLSDVATPIAKAQLAAALAMVGDKARADNAYLAALDALAPQPMLDLRPRRLRVGTARRGGVGDARLRKAARRATIDDAVQRVDAARAPGGAYTRPRRTPGWCWPRALSPSSNSVSLNVNGETRQGALYRNLRPDDLASRPMRSPTTATATCRRSSRSRVAADAGARGRKRLQDRAQLPHA